MYCIAGNFVEVFNLVFSEFGIYCQIKKIAKFTHTYGGKASDHQIITPLPIENHYLMLAKVTHYITSTSELFICMDRAHLKFKWHLYGLVYHFFKASRLKIIKQLWTLL